MFCFAEAHGSAGRFAEEVSDRERPSERVADEPNQQDEQKRHPVAIRVLPAHQPLPGAVALHRQRVEPRLHPPPRPQVEQEQSVLQDLPWQDVHHRRRPRGGHHWPVALGYGDDRPHRTPHEKTSETFLKRVHC